MGTTIRKISKPLSFKSVLSAAKKLTEEEKQMLHLQLFNANALQELKKFEQNLKKTKTNLKKTDKEIVNITTAIRKKQYAK